MRQHVEGARSTIGAIRDLVKKQPERSTLAVRYAPCLFSLPSCLECTIRSKRITHSPSSHHTLLSAAAVTTLCGDKCKVTQKAPCRHRLTVGPLPLVDPSAKLSLPSLTHKPFTVLVLFTLDWAKGSTPIPTRIGTDGCQTISPTTMGQNTAKSTTQWMRKLPTGSCSVQDLTICHPAPSLAAKADNSCHTNHDKQTRPSNTKGKGVKDYGKTLPKLNSCKSYNTYNSLK